jgi:hypothetical protein
MVHATARNPSRKLKPLFPHPEPSVKWVKTHLALCFSGVSMSNETQIAIDASTLVGANQRIILCNILELSEQMMPMMMRRRMVSRTVCKALGEKE